MEAESPVSLRRSSLTSFVTDEEEDDGFMMILDEEELKVQRARGHPSRPPNILRPSCSCRLLDRSLGSTGFGS